MDFDLNYENKEKLNINIYGDLDINSVNFFEDKVLEIYSLNKKDIILNLKDLNYIDSTGLGSIMTIYNELNKDGKNFKIINPKKNILKLFKITELDTIFGMEG